MIKRNSMIPAFVDPAGNSIGSIDFDNSKVYSDTFIFDGLVSI